MDEQSCQVSWVDVRLIDQNNECVPSAGEVVLEKTETGYRLLSGQKELQSCLSQGLTHVAAIIRPKNDPKARLDALLTRMAGGQLNFLQEARACQALLDGDELSLGALCLRLGKSQAAVQRRLKLLSLSSPVQKAVEAGGLTEKQAQLLLRIPGEQGRLSMAQHIALKGLNGVQTERLIDEMLTRMPLPMARQGRMTPLIRDYRLYLNAIRSIVEQMQLSGVDAQMAVSKGSRIVEMRVTVPVFQTKAAKQS